MKMIYNFEQFDPPVITETSLRTKGKARKVHQQAALVSLAGALMQLCILVLAVFLYDWYPVAAALFLCYVVVSSVGSGILAAVFWKQRKVMIL